MPKIGFIITTFMRDSLLYKSIQSLLKYKQDNWEVIIIDQNGNFKKHDDFNNNMKLHYYSVDYNSGLSFGRNFGVKVAKDLGCCYCFISSDSFLFNKSIQKLNNIVKIMEDCDYDLIGTELTNSVCGWEAKLNLIKGQSFELDFVNKNKPDKIIYPNEDITSECSCHISPPCEHCIQKSEEIHLWNIDICRNVFIAKIDTLLNVKWDENLKLGEHEDFFWRSKRAGYKGCWTNYIIVDKQTERPDEYAKFRKQNFNEGIKKLREKYNISGWVSYKNLDRAKEYYKKKES